jgi:hypothetical protein
VRDAAEARVVVGETDHGSTGVRNETVAVMQRAHAFAPLRTANDTSLKSARAR